MKNILAIDVASDKSDIGLFSNYGEVLIEPMVVKHEKQDFDNLIEKIKACKLENLDVIMESTSVYHYPVEAYFKNLGYKVIVINPLISKMFKSNLRKIKTDRADCVNLANIYFANMFNKQYTNENEYKELMYLSRQYESLTQSKVRYKNRFKQLISIIFPEYKKVFTGTSIFNYSNLIFLRKYPHPVIISNTRIDALINTFNTVYNIKLPAYKTKCLKLKEIASNSFYGVTKDSNIVDNMIDIINLILDIDKVINNIKSKLLSQAQKIDIFSNINSIYGIGELSAALLLSEIGDLRRFDNIKQLRAFCGLHPKIVQSGNSINHSGKLVKTGNKLSRKYLFNSAVTIIKLSSHKHPNNKILLHYKKKRNEGKHHYASVIACTTKLLGIMYSLCIHNNQYQ